MNVTNKNKVKIKYIIKEIDTNNIILGDKFSKYEIDLSDKNDLTDILYSVLKNKSVGFSSKFKFNKKEYSEFKKIEEFNLKDYPESALYFEGEVIIFGVEKKRVGRVISMDNEKLTVDFNNPLRRNDITLEIKLLDIY